MRRLVTCFLLAFALVLSGPALAAPSHDCPMARAGDMAANHQDMGCCKLSCSSECAVACPAAVEPLVDHAAGPDPLVGARLAAQPVRALASVSLSGADPPPRPTFS